MPKALHPPVVWTTGKREATNFHLLICSREEHPRLADSWWKFTFLVAMKNFLLLLAEVSLLLLAGVGVLGDEPLEFKFGDLIRFPGHYGLALGERDQHGGELFFHKSEHESCEIKALNPGTTVKRSRDNYQDVPGHELTSQEINDIRNRLNECKNYNNNDRNKPCCGIMTEDNNCEHTVTYIRYGLPGRVSCLGWWQMLKYNLNPPPPRPTLCANWALPK